MGIARGYIKYLDNDEMSKIHEGVLTILEDIGMKIEHPEAVELLRGIGCIVDDASCVVKFPRNVTENAINKMRKDFTLSSRDGLTTPMRYTEMYLSTKTKGTMHNFTANAGGFPTFVVDLDGKRRDATMQDVRDSIKLANALENIDLIGLPCSAQEVPYIMRPIIMTAELIKNTSKPGGIEAWTKEDIRYITQMGSAIRGGMDSLKKNPFLIGYGETRSPLSLDYNMCEIFMEYIKMGLPQSFDTMPCAGTTAPATSAGTLTLGLAETIFGLILGYAVDENALVSIELNPSLADMRTMIFPYSGADRIPLMAATNQMLREFYGRPGGCHAGKTDACFPGVQAGMEKALSSIMPILCGATGIGTLGQLEGGLVFSYVQLALDNEILGYIRRILRGFEVTDETIALDVIKDVGIGGNFIDHEHTAMNFRNEFYISDLLERFPWSAWDAQEVKGMEERAREKVKRILSEPNPDMLDDAMSKEIDTIVAVAEKEILK